jgi:hypothetical protein
MKALRMRVALHELIAAYPARASCKRTSATASQGSPVERRGTATSMSDERRADGHL